MMAEPLLHAREGTTEGAQLELFDWQRMQPMLYEEEEMVNSSCRVSKDCHSMWTDGLEFSRKPMGPEGGHARWREQPEQSPEDVHPLSMFREP